MNNEFSVTVYRDGLKNPQPLLVKSNASMEEAYMSNNIKNQALYVQGVKVFLENTFPCYKEYQNVPARNCSIGFYNVSFLAHSIENICKN